MGTQLPQKRAQPPPQFMAHVCCGQTAGWIKMPLGTDADLGPGQLVLDGDPAPPPRKHSSHLFLAHIYCGKQSPISDTAELLFVLILCCSEFLLIGECVLLLC